MSSQPEDSASRRIVVGVDGSGASCAALSWAVRQAELTGATVEAVIAWHYPALIGAVPYAPAAIVDPAEFGRTAAANLSKAIAAAVDPASPVKISSTVRHGEAADVLLDTAGGADLLVVGSRGHGGFTAALLGSVSQHCVHHARCPVVVIRAAAR